MIINYDDLVYNYRLLSAAEKQRFYDEEISGNADQNRDFKMDAAIAAHRYSKGRFCPNCEKNHVVRNGTRKDGVQKYHCLDCGRYFTAASNTVMAGTHKDYETWRKFVRCMIDGKTVRGAARSCGISKNTAWEWRQKVLGALSDKMADKVILDGIVEADETFVAVSYKGSRNLPRPAHKRGKSVHTRGLSREQVCVYTAVNRNGRSVAVVGNLGSANKASLHKSLDNRICPGSYLCSDGLGIYGDLAKVNKLNHIILKGGKISKGIYHIQNLNRYHRDLKKFLNGFNGVSTKYLDRYLAWHNLINYTSSPDEQKEHTLTNFLLSTSYHVKNADISIRSSIPSR